MCNRITTSNMVPTALGVQVPIADHMAILEALRKAFPRGASDTGGWGKAGAAASGLKR